jgi:hypothetical protein
MLGLDAVVVFRERAAQKPAVVGNVIPLKLGKNGDFWAGKPPAAEKNPFKGCLVVDKPSKNGML